jgi:hypothetical protein
MRRLSCGAEEVTSRLGNRLLECEPSPAAMLDCVPIAQPLARRDGGLVRSTSNSSAGGPERIDAEPRSYIALDLGHLLSGGTVECETDWALRLAYVEVGSIAEVTEQARLLSASVRPSSMSRRRRPRSEDRTTRDTDPDRRRELIAELWTEDGAQILPRLRRYARSPRADLHREQRSGRRRARVPAARPGRPHPARLPVHRDLSTV